MPDSSEKRSGPEAPFSERLRAQYGSDVDPRVTLSLETDGSESSELNSDVLTRLSQRGHVTNRYRLESEIARGGMGAVLGVFDEDLRRHLAMKVMLAERAEGRSDTPATDPKQLSRFLEEAQVTSQLDHPGIVPVHELGLDSQDRVYFTMKLVKGKTLKDAFEELWSGEGDWTQTRVLSLLLRVCEAMSYAHAKGVIHRDLKPGNVMVGRFGEVYVMDWGLARVLGREDVKDIRVRQPALTTSELRSERRDHAGETPDSPLYTMDGDVVGTPAYMPPEQAAGRLSEMGPHSDVYAVGAMLYHLLVGHMPYLPPGTRASNYTILRWVQDGPPRPVHEIAPTQPAELVAICERAMERDPERRYADMRALAAELQAYLEGRVVLAYETGAVAELKKWIVRNKPLAGALATALLLLVFGLTASLSLFVLAKENRQVQARLAAESDLEKLENLQSLAQEMWPALPERVEAYQDWLKNAEDLVASLDQGEHGTGHRAQLAQIEARATPWTDQERDLSRRTHPRFEELVQLEDELAARRRGLDVRTGMIAFAEVGLEPNELLEDTRQLSRLARQLTRPDRKEFGREPKGLALARRAHALAPGASSEAVEASLTLGWALLANGLDDEARKVMKEAEDSVPADLRPNWNAARAQLQGALESATTDAQATIAELETRQTKLDAEVSKRREWHFEERDRWWHKTLKKLVDGIEAFAHPETGTMRGQAVWGVARRLAWAESVVELTLEDSRWPGAIGSIADETQCPQYHGLVLRPQLGLVPIGRDPSSGLWEFAHLQTGVEAKRNQDGRLANTEECGLVFVLIPGGTFTRGAQATDTSAPGYDPEAAPDEGPLQTLALSPFFLSKYEMTQAQWEPLTGGNPSSINPRDYRGVTRTHPVESVAWATLENVMFRLDFSLPSEAQWEYAARGGTLGPWSTGDSRESLAGFVNIADLATKRAGAKWPIDTPELDDGFVYHAPVGSFGANRFGLHDVHGNVAEWVQDSVVAGAYSLAANKDPVSKSTDKEAMHVFRGGGFQGMAFNARSAVRSFHRGDSGMFFVGIRPARALQR